MKRSKILLGTTACPLAIAGVAATEDRNLNVTESYKTAGIGQTCVSKTFSSAIPGTIYTCRTSCPTEAIIYIANNGINKNLYGDF